MKRYLMIILAFLVTSTGMTGQEEAKKEKNFGIKFSGFVKSDFFWDSRQTVAAREGHFLLWPDPIVEDANGKDINAQSSFNILSLQSRLSGAISGPDVFGAKSSALIEGDFFAQANDNINLLRLRHAWIKLNWENLELLAGQYWNPLFITGSFPGTVSFNTGTPLQSFARNPQLRATYKLGGLSFIGALLAQRDYSNVGEFGGSTAYLRNSSSPDMHLQLHYQTRNEGDFNILAGAGFAYKTIAPRVSNDRGAGEIYAVHERVGGMTAIGFFKLSTRPLTIKLQGRYGENISDLLAISGFGVTDTTTASGKRSYTPLKGMTFWGEIHSNGNPQVGIFGGYTKNLGSKEAVITDNLYDNLMVYGRAVNIRALFRIAPRLIYNVGKMRLAMEVEYTSAYYGASGTTYSEFYIPRKTTPADNLRVLAAVYYFF